MSDAFSGHAFDCGRKCVLNVVVHSDSKDIRKASLTLLFDASNYGGNCIECGSS